MPSPISTTKQYYDYNLDARDIEIMLLADNAVSDLKMYWTISWIHHLKTDYLDYDYENGKRRFKMRFHLDEYSSRSTSSGVTANDRMPVDGLHCVPNYDVGLVGGRGGAIRLKYTLNGEIRYFDISVNQGIFHFNPNK